MTSIKRSTPIRPSRTSCLSCSMASMPRIYQNVGIPAAPVFNFLRTAKPLFSGNLRQKYDSYIRIAIAPKDLLRSLFELGIESRCFPIASAVRLQIDIVQDLPHGAWADASDNPILYGLAGQVNTRPMSDVQPFGHRFQTSELDDPCPLHRGNLQVTSRMASSLVLKQAGESQVSIPLTGSVDGGFIAVALGSKSFASPTFSDSQNNTSTPNLERGQPVAVSDPFQFRDIRGEDRQCIGSTSTHVSSFWKDDGHPFHHAL